MANAQGENTQGMKRESISRSDVRSATIHAYKTVRSSPKSVRITPGQHGHIIKPTK